MITGIKYFNNDVIYTVFRKHYCPKCKTKLIRVKKSKVVNSNSPEAKNYDFSSVDSYMCGNIKFIWKEFKCPDCNEEFTVRRMKQLEAVQKRQEREKRFLQNENDSQIKK